MLAASVKDSPTKYSVFIQTPEVQSGVFVCVCLDAVTLGASTQGPAKSTEGENRTSKATLLKHERTNLT